MKYKTAFNVAKTIMTILTVFGIFITIIISMMIYQLVENQTQLSGFLYGYFAGCAAFASLLFALIRTEHYINNTDEKNKKRVYSSGLLLLANSFILLVVAGWAYSVQFIKSEGLPENVRQTIINVGVTFIIFLTLIFFIVSVVKMSRFLFDTFDKYMDSHLPDK